MLQAMGLGSWLCGGLDANALLGASVTNVTARVDLAPVLVR